MRPYLDEQVCSGQFWEKMFEIEVYYRGVEQGTRNGDKHARPEQKQILQH